VQPNITKRNIYADCVNILRRRICHIVSACPIMAKEQYVKGYDTVCSQLHFKKCEEIGA
jgi:hypothetical protein